MSSDKIIGKHVFVFDKSPMSGESLNLETKIFHDDRYGKDGLYYQQELKLKSWRNSAVFNLYEGQLNPSSLRKLADELEKIIEELRNTV